MIRIPSMADASGKRRQGELLSGVFQLLSSHSEGLPAKEVLSKLRATVPPTTHEASEYPNRPGVVRYDKIVRFGSIPFVKAGWLVKRKGQWSATEDGLAAFRQYAHDPEGFMREAIKRYRQWKKDQPEPAEDLLQASDEAAEALGTLEEAEESAFAEIKDYVDRMAPYDFQDLVAALVSAMGYHVRWIAPPGPDQGIDIIAGLDQLGLSDPRVKVQVKHRTAVASVSDVREFMAVLGQRDVGIYVSTGGFTKDAMELARSHETRRLTLVDLEELLDLWASNYTKIEEIKRRLLPLKAVYYLSLLAQG
jgi:restriction system protein